jgi:GNAT superfamily N-acetyltransferase
MEGILDEVKIRRYNARSDFGHIIKSWMFGFLYSGSYAKGVPSLLYKAEHGRLIEHTIAECYQTIKVACDPEHEDQILGFLIGSPGILHYICVKKVYRRFGVGRYLIEAGFKNEETSYHTHETAMTHYLGLKSIYNPYIFLNPQHSEISWRPSLGRR